MPSLHAGWPLLGRQRYNEVPANPSNANRVWKDMLTVNNQIRIPLRELKFTFSRSSGPGGQNVNKVNTKAHLRWAIHESDALPESVRDRFVARYHRRIAANGDLLVTSQRFRDRGRNIADCLEKLRELVLSVATPPKKRKPTKPSKGSKARRRKAKEANSQKKRMRKPPTSD